MLPFETLPALAGPVLERLQGSAQDDERIIAVLAGGSAVAGTMDEFSDLDLVIVCRDGDEAFVVAEIRERAARLGPLLAAFTGEHVGESRLLIALYGPPLLHVDLKVIALAELAERVENVHVLWARDDAVDRAMAETDAVWPSSQPQWIEDRFWVWVHYAAAKIGRGELFECLDALALLRSAALGPLIARRNGQRAQGVRRLERYAPDLRDDLAATIGDHSRAGCAGALRAAADLYRRLRDDEPALVRHDEAEHQALAFLDAVNA